MKSKNNLFDLFKVYTMNTQNTRQLRNSKKNISKSTENTWNNIKEIVQNRKLQKLQKKKSFEEKFSDISNILETKYLSSKYTPNERTFIIRVPKNITSGQMFELFIDGTFIKIRCPVNSESGKQISFKIQTIRNIYKEVKDLINIRRTYKIMYQTGLYYGYPKCCINAFVLKTVNQQKEEPIQELAGRYTGYVPCVKCSKKITSNCLSVEDLIKNRKCNTKFPYDDEGGHIIPCKKHAQLIFLKKITMYQVIKSGCKDCYVSDDENENEDECQEK